LHIGEVGDHPTIGKNFETDQRAIDTFKHWLPVSWLKREQHPDVFVDFVVETVENGEPTGLHFEAQIKGIHANKPNEATLAFPFKTKHLRYYLKRCQYPVFLFRINTATGEGYWLCAQQYLRERVLADALDKQKTVTIHFSPKDNLSALEEFKLALSQAEKYVRDLHPGSIEAAIHKRKIELESKDPRVSVAIATHEGKQHVTITPKEEFSFITKFPGVKPEAWKDFVERGSELKVQSSEVEVHGFPLLEEFSKSGKGDFTIQHGTPLPSYIQLFVDDKGHPRVVQIEGTFRRGTKFGVFRGSIPDSPFEMSLEIAFDSINTAEAQTSYLTFSMDKWVGQPVLLLSHFEQFDLIIQELSKAGSPRMDIFIQGNRVWSGHIGEFNKQAMRDMSFMMNWLRKCRLVAQHFQINPRLLNSKSISDEQWEDVEAAYDLITSGQVSEAVGGLSLSMTVTKFPSKNNIASERGTVAIPKQEHSFNILGQVMAFGPVVYAFTEMKLVSQSCDVGGKTHLVFEGTENSRQILSRLQGPFRLDEDKIGDIQQ
jgi:Domain of unknown function (DUF4365)